MRHTNVGAKYPLGRYITEFAALRGRNETTWQALDRIPLVQNGNFIEPN